jgi:hypothetical protein
MERNELKTIFLGIVACVVFLVAVSLIGVAYINNTPGFYTYVIRIEGLQNYQPTLITDIIIPIPDTGEEGPGFTDEDFQYQTFGDWRSMLVMTPYGKMLAFESIGRNLTDINAIFTKAYDGGIRIEDINRSSFQPVLPVKASGYTQWIDGKDSGLDYSTIVYIPDSIHPLRAGNANISFSLDLTASEGMQHSISGKRYHMVVREEIPAGVRNWTQVVAQVE